MFEKLPLLAWPRDPRLSILMYHRVLPTYSPLFPEEVDAERFESQMRYLARNFTVLPLLEAVRGLRNGSLPSRSISITFDDGYADNLTVALPIMEKFGLTATVFVATAYIDGGCMFNDAIAEMVTRTTCRVLDLQELGLKRYDTDTIEHRRESINSIRKIARFYPPEQRNELVEKISRIAGVESLSKDLMLTKAQVLELSRRGIEIGGHTITHPVLTSVDDNRAKTEIMMGKKTLEDWIGKPVRSFAYPNGLPGRDLTNQHANMVRGSGFELAVTTGKGIASRLSDPFQLPRFVPWGNSMVKLGARMVREAWRLGI
jgi:peptidoglycan/xylan/chitin deacetylase (PgdA/CDA1 family)